MMILVAIIIFIITEVKAVPCGKVNLSLLKDEIKYINLTEILPHNYKKVHPDNGKILDLLHIVFRHGERTPADTYPNDPYINFTYEPYGWGQITNDGKRKLYESGKWLRRRYDKFLGADYFPEIIHAQATDVFRTKMSLLTILAGLFPPKGTGLEWNKQLNWQPTPIYSQLLNEDTLLLVRINCPRYYEALEEVLKTSKISDKIKDSEQMLKELTTLTGMEIKTADDVSSLWSTLRAQEAYGLELPEWTKDYYPKQMQELADLSYIWNTYTPELKRIKGGPFITKMSNEWKEKLNNNFSKTKLYIYGGHDTTVTNILQSLGIWRQQFPEYLVMAIFELYKDISTNKYEIKIYQKNEGENPRPLILPGCMESCPLEEVLKLIEPLIITSDLTKYCTPNNASYIPPIILGP